MPAPTRPDPARHLRRRLGLDRLTTFLVRAGGMAIILGILGILVFILVEVWPLTRAARVEAAGVVDTGLPPFLAIQVDEYQSHVVGIGRDGRVRGLRFADHATVLDEALVPALAGPPNAPEAAEVVPPDLVAAAAPPGGSELVALSRDGRARLVLVRWETRFIDGQQTVAPALGAVHELTLADPGTPVEAFTARLGEDGSATAVGVVAGELVVVRREVSVNAITGEESEEVNRLAAPLPLPVSRLLLDHAQKNLYAASPTGELLHWTLSDAAVGEADRGTAGTAAVTALSLLSGDRSLVVGQADGALSVWFRVRQPGDAFKLTRVRDFPAQPSAVLGIVPSLRNKGFVAVSEGQVGLYHSTSERTLWRGKPGLAGLAAVGLPSRANGIVLAGQGADGNGRLERYSVWNPHPEITWKSLFGKVWYEGYEKPELVWQSTGGSDDFEPKLSLTPLVVGTLKGTFFSLVLAIPLGVLGAMYTSQFMHPALKRKVKPTVEIMAALPTVVLGFLAGLWLAPRVERLLPGLVLMLIVLPLAVVGAGALWHRQPLRVRNRYPSGVEALGFVVVLGVAIALCVRLSSWLELALFAGSFTDWLRETTGLAYDQRNAIVVGLAMGFAVIPIIFAIAEDAFSNVPRNLVSGSLALGANRWQTVTRVVLPTASPGIFSAIMVGFGRAIGETMIVLMATGNTPIMDWSPFNGFRTLSANIAVEIPEAPAGSTLYRTLFLAALALFILTFLVNTAAEVVRQRLRSRYSRL